MSPSPRPRAAGPAPVAALQAALAAENSAVYGYGIVGAHLAGPRRAAAVRDWIAHQTARDTLTAMLTARGSQPVPAAAGYDLPFGVHSPAAAMSLAALIEDRLTGAYLGLVAVADQGLRAFGAAAMRSAALRAAAWRGRTLAFPGLGAPSPTRPAPAAGGTGPATPPNGPSGSPAPSHPG